MSRRSAQVVGVGRRDAYSLLFFNDDVSIALENDFSHDPHGLLTIALQYKANSGTSFTSALKTAQTVMEQCWSADRCVIKSLNAVPSTYGI
jgi:hypothetical protein